MNNVNLENISFDILNKYNVIHFFSCKPFSYLNDNIYKYFNLSKDIRIVKVNSYVKRGVKEKNIYISNLCTTCNNNLFHSYRKDNHTKDRNISIIYKKHDTIF